jgi:hypothetical protein
LFPIDFVNFLWAIRYRSSPINDPSRQLQRPSSSDWLTPINIFVAIMASGDVHGYFTPRTCHASREKYKDLDHKLLVKGRVVFINVLDLFNSLGVFDILTFIYQHRKRHLLSSWFIILLFMCTRIKTSGQCSRRTENTIKHSWWSSRTVWIRHYDRNNDL